MVRIAGRMHLDLCRNSSVLGLCVSVWEGESRHAQPPAWEGWPCHGGLDPVGKEVGAVKGPAERFFSLNLGSLGLSTLSGDRCVVLCQGEARRAWWYWTELWVWERREH